VLPQNVKIFALRTLKIGAMDVERLCLWELCEGNLEGGLSCWGP